MPFLRESHCHCYHYYCYTHILLTTVREKERERKREHVRVVRYCKLFFYRFLSSPICKSINSRQKKNAPKTMSQPSSVQAVSGGSSSLATLTSSPSSTDTFEIGCEICVTARVSFLEKSSAFSIAFNERVLVPEIPASGDGRRVLVDDIGGETV